MPRRTEYSVSIPDKSLTELKYRIKNQRRCNMPGFDGTGPRGMGPMTGGGRGFCIVPGTRPSGRPYGIRRGAGYGYANRVVPTSDRELDSLKSEMQSLKDSLNRIESRVEKLTEK
jgi:hypothetical protein